MLLRITLFINDKENATNAYMGWFDIKWCKLSQATFTMNADLNPTCNCLRNLSITF